MRLPALLLCMLLGVLAEEHARHGTPTKEFEARHSEGGHNPDLDHQAVLGSRRTAAEFDSLSPEESRRRLRVLAQRVDVDGDGVVTPAELEAWVYRSLLSLDEEETKERFEEIDQDHDGQVSWAEYVHEAFGTDDAQGLDSEYAKLLAEDRIYFTAADLNKDNNLTEAEFSAFQNPEHHEHMHDALIRNTLAEKDTNKDGRIDLKEFLGDIFDQPQSEFYLTEKSRFQQDYDKDGDGFLDGAELRAWLIPNLKVVAKEEAAHLISSADKDQNGNLTIDEIVDDYSTFVGSEATNFGEQLNEIHHEEL